MDSFSHVGAGDTGKTNSLLQRAKMEMTRTRVSVSSHQKLSATEPSLERLPLTV